MNTAMSEISNLDNEKIFMEKHLTDVIKQDFNYPTNLFNSLLSKTVTCYPKPVNTMG